MRPGFHYDPYANAQRPNALLATGEFGSVCSPNDPTVQTTIGAASALLLQRTASSSLEGTAHRIRTHREVPTHKLGNCPDLAGPYEAALAVGGLNPILCLVEGRSLPGDSLRTPNPGRGTSHQHGNSVDQ